LGENIVWWISNDAETIRLKNTTFTYTNILSENNDWNDPDSSYNQSSQLPIPDTTNAYSALTYTKENGKIENLNYTILTENSTEHSRTKYFMIESPFNFGADSFKIAAIDSDKITIQPTPSEALESEEIKVLFSIESTKLISNPLMYIDVCDELLDNKNNFLVPSVQTVSDINNANKVYSPRELLSIPERKLIPAGEDIAALSEDTEHNIYQWYDPYINEYGQK